MSAYDASGLATQLLGALNDPVRAAVRRCSVVTSFDEPLYDEILRQDGGPELEELVGVGCIEATSGWSRFQVPRSLRDAAWSSWWSESGLAPAHRKVPPKLRQLASRVAEREATPPEEEIRALVLVDADRAADEFTRVYAERDAMLDYPGCQDLLDVLARPELLPLLSPRLVELRNDRDRYLRARLFWHSSMVATARYLPRPVVEARLGDLVAGRAPQVMRMRATGGMGKSTVVHRFVAWECVPRRVPCALADLDSSTFDADVAVRHPWLVLLEFAAQLNLQIDGAPYQELLREYGVYASMLRPAAGDAARSTSAAAADPGALSRYAGDVVERFQRVTAALDASVLLVVDTLEEATLNYPDAEPLIALLADLCDAAPQAKLVLSGRGTSCEADMPSLGRLFPDAEVADLVIEPFTPEEADRYLREVRGLTDDAYVSAVVTRAGGSPWLLGMYADVAAYRSADPSVVTSFDPFLAWCVDRVLARLRSGTLQWLVRYGVIPRRLDRDLAEQVIYPRIVASMTGSPDDRPEHDNRPPHSEQLFPTGDPPDESFDQVWDQLARYANESSWARISRDRRTVWLDAALSGPMRRMLGEQPVSRLLHTAAADWFRATGDRPEELYHLFHLDPAQWADRWRQSVDECWSRLDLDGVLTLTADALRPDYGGEPDPFGEHRGPAVDAPSRAYGYTEQAWALTMKGRRDGFVPGDPLWASALRLARIASVHNMPHRRARWLAAHATCMLMGGQYAGALRALDNGAEPGDPAVGAELALLRVEALTGLGRYAEARDAVEPLVAAPVPARVFPWTLARIGSVAAVLACHQGRVDRACELVDGLLHAASVTAYDDLSALRARLTLDAGAPEQALKFLEGASDRDLRIEALLGRGEPEAALTMASESDLPGDAVGRARRLMVRARCSAALLDHLDVLRSLDLAFAIWMSVQDKAAAALTALTKVELLLETSGDLHASQSYLEEFDRLQPAPAGTHLGRHAIVAARVAAARGNRTAAYAICVRALETLAAQDEDVLLRAEVAVQALAVASPDDAETMADTVGELLGRIAPRAVRLRLLSGLRHASGPVPAARRWIGDTDGVSRDEPCRLRWAAEVQLAAGETDKSVETAARAGCVTLYARWLYTEFLSRAGRLDLAPPPEPVPPGLPNLRDADLVVRLENTEPDDEALRRLDLDGLTQWTARAHLARSRMLRRLGRDDEALAAAYRAREIYGELGDPREDDAELAAYAADARSVLPTWGSLYDIRIGAGGAATAGPALRRVTEFTGRVVRLSVDDKAAPEPLEITVPWPAVARAVIRAPRESTRVKTEVRIMQFALTLLGYGPGPIDGRFGRRTRKSLAAFQRDAIPPADGEAGPLTWAALTRAVRDLPARKPAVLSLERDVEDSFRSARGATHAGAPLAFLFGSLGWRHGSLDLLDPRVPPVDLLYINGSMESSGQVPVVSAGSQTYGYESPWRAAAPADSLTVTMFDRFLSAAAVANGLPPAIVMDVSLPTAKSEADRQLRLRNDFAHRLMSMGHAPIILATGSGPGASQDALVQVLDVTARTGRTGVELLVPAREKQAYEAAVALFSAAPVERFPVIATTRVGRASAQPEQTS